MFRAITLKEEYPRDISNKITYQLIKKVKAGQSLFEFEEGNKKYEIYEGDAWIMQGPKGEMVSKGEICIVEKGMPHTVLSSKTSQCKFVMEVIGDYDLVKVINDNIQK